MTEVFQRRRGGRRKLPEGEKMRVYNFVMLPQLADRLHEAAARRDESASSFVRRLIQEHLDADERAQ